MARATSAWTQSTVAKVPTRTFTAKSAMVKDSGLRATGMVREAAPCRAILIWLSKSRFCKV